MEHLYTKKMTRMLINIQWAERDSNSHDQRPPHFECGASTNFAIRPNSFHIIQSSAASVTPFSHLPVSPAASGIFI